MSITGALKSVLRKIKTAIKIFQDDGYQRVLYEARLQYNLPLPQRAIEYWKQGIKPEIKFWDGYFRTRGLCWKDSYHQRMDPELPLRSRVQTLLPSLDEIYILDVGAGPLTYLGKKYQGKKIIITATDPLADSYDILLKKYNIIPIVKTKKIAAEELSTFFEEDTFDLVYARNSIDHCYNPEKAILEMIKVLKQGGWILLEHRVNEANRQHNQGFHQWNFSMSTVGDFVISSKFSRVNITNKHSKICEIECEVNYEMDGNWLITRIYKK